jgi:hypothetical protein
MQVLGTTGGAAGQGGAPSMSRQPGDDRADLYDATSHIWLELFGEHVHVGEFSVGPQKQVVPTVAWTPQPMQSCWGWPIGATNTPVPMLCLIQPGT